MKETNHGGNPVKNLGPLCVTDQKFWKNALSQSSSRKVIKRPRNLHRIPNPVLPRTTSKPTLDPDQPPPDVTSHRPDFVVRNPLVTKYVSIWPRFGQNEYDVFVGNLECCISASTLASWFEPFANVLHARIITDHSSGQSRGFGFVTFGSEPSMNTAIRALNGTKQAGKIIRVEPSSPKVSEACANSYVCAGLAYYKVMTNSN